MKKSHPEVVVVGGGPAGCACATVLADRGHEVWLLEKEKFPRHHIGESLIPETYSTFERIGMLEKMKASPFVRKFSVQFFSASGKGSRPFYFFETNPHESSSTWQVLRSEFDKMMIENAREHGARVEQGVTVRDVLFEGDRAVGVSAKMADGKTRELRARVIVDATGLNAILSKKLRIRHPDPRLKKAAIYGYFRGAKRDPGVDEGATLVIRTHDSKGWFWSIPLHDDTLSVGLVSTPENLFRKNGADYQKVFDRAIRACRPIGSRIEQAEQVGDLVVISDFSYRSSRQAGPGYILIGDAYGFLDPVFSTGVHLALKSGELAGDAIHDALEANDVSGERLGVHAPMLNAGIEAFRKLVYAYYTPDFSFGEFIRSHPEHHGELVDLLIGDVFKGSEFRIFDSMGKWCDLPQPFCTSSKMKESVAS